MMVSLSASGAGGGGGDVGLYSGRGDNITLGPVHFERLATTLASRDRSVNETFGWPLI